MEEGSLGFYGTCPKEVYPSFNCNVSILTLFICVLLRILMKKIIFAASVILASITGTCSILASESPLTKKFSEQITAENINLENGYCERHFLGKDRFTSFIAAAIDAGDLCAVKFLLANGVDAHNKIKVIDISSMNCNGEQPLHYAIRKQRSDIVRLLLGEGADYNAEGIDGERPFHIALKVHFAPILSVLLHQAKDLDLGAKDLHNNTALHFAAPYIGLDQAFINGITDGVSADIINAQNSNGDTALNIALRAKNAEFAMALLDRTENNLPVCNLTLCDAQGNAPLHVAAAIVDPSLPQNLLQRLVTYTAELPCAGGKAINQLQRVDPNGTALSIAVRCNNMELIKLLLALRAINPNKPDATGKTPLVLAIELGNRECAQSLLALQGISPNIPDATGKTPLVLAIEKGDEQTVEKLLACEGIDPNVPDSRGNTAAHYAVTAGVPLALRNALLTHPRVKYSIEGADAARSSGSYSPMSFYWYTAKDSR